MRALLITSVPSPFQVELVEATRSSAISLDMDVWFKSGLPRHRGEHWLSKVVSDKSFFNHHPTVQTLSTELEGLIALNSYDVVIVGLAINFSLKKTLQPVLEANIPIVVWNEQPIPKSYFLDKLKKCIYRFVFRQVKPKAIFCIGDRAYSKYAEISQLPVRLVPYFQELPNGKDIHKEQKSTRGFVKFVFSGRLIKRNNIIGILDAVSYLVDSCKITNFVVEFFGRGEYEAEIEGRARLYPENISLLNGDMKCWEDRLKPVASADVLLCPGFHSGWGLTIPEALALGVPVISSAGIESARYYVKDGINGFLCQTDFKSIARNMKLFICNAELAKTMEPKCVESSKYGSSEYGALAMQSLLRDVV